MILPWARVLISAGAHGLRRIPGQSVNLAHPIWRAPRAPAPLQGAPPVVFRAGLFGVYLHLNWCSSSTKGFAKAMTT